MESHLHAYQEGQHKLRLIQTEQNLVMVACKVALPVFQGARRAT